MGDINVSRTGHVATVEINRPPNNFLDMELIGEVAGAFEEIDRDDQVRAVVLCSAGKHFCAGANLGQRLANEAAGKPAATGKR
jgi:enoyl-CoA hydratase/carnithine racemase